MAKYSLDIPDELKEKMEAKAKENRRSLNAEILVACDNHVEEEK